MIALLAEFARLRSSNLAELRALAPGPRGARTCRGGTPAWGR